MKIIEKRNYIILAIIIILIIFLVIENIGVKEYSKIYKYFDHSIMVKIYENKDVFDDINKIYEKYDNLNEKERKKIYEEVNYESDVISAYATNEVVKYLKKNNIDKYLINDNGDITAGKHYENEKYKISINAPSNGDILEIVSIKNQSMVTRNNKGNYDMVVVVADDVITASIIADKLCFMDLEEGKKLAKYYKVLWYKAGKIEKENFE